MSSLALLEHPQIAFEVKNQPLASDDLQLEIYRNFLQKKTLSYSEKVPTTLCTEVIRGCNQNAASRAASDDLGRPQWFKMKNLHIFSSVEVLFCAKCIEKMSKNTNSKFKNCPLGGGQNGGQNARSVKFFN